MVAMSKRYESDGGDVETYATVLATILPKILQIVHRTFQVEGKGGSRKRFSSDFPHHSRAIRTVHPGSNRRPEGIPGRANGQEQAWTWSPRRMHHVRFFI